MSSYGKPKGWPGFPIPAHLFLVFVEWARNWPNWPPSKLNAITAHKSEIDNGLIASPTNDGSSDRMLFVPPSVISNLEETWAMCPGQMSLCLPKCPSLSFIGQRPHLGLYETKQPSTCVPGRSLADSWTRSTTGARQPAGTVLSTHKFTQQITKAVFTHQ